jgi:hypothetical protein
LEKNGTLLVTQNKEKRTANLRMLVTLATFASEDEVYEEAEEAVNAFIKKEI